MDIFSLVCVLNICFSYLKYNVNCIFESCTPINVFFILLLNRYFKIKLGEITNTLYSCRERKKI